MFDNFTWSRVASVHKKLVMKILAFSDLHRDTNIAQRIAAASANADVIVGAGDFANNREGAADTIKILRTCVKPVVLVHGNHDDPKSISELCAGWSEGHYLHGNAITIAGYDFFGLGGEIPSRNNASWNSTETELKAKELLQHCPDRAILITHTPPFGCADKQADGSHEGSNSIRMAIQAKKPVLCVCGHIHHSWGKNGKVGSTPIYNLGPNINWFEV